jgi:hypothetical protein
MQLFARRFLFLLLLLAVDWYFDTSLGQSPFDRPMSSTEACCESLVYKQRLCELLAVDAITTPLVFGASLDQVFTSMHC